MTKTYNITTHGNVVNTNGILSNFSSTNYATLPIKLPTSGVTQFELDLEFTTGPDVTTERCLISQTTDDWSGFKLDIVDGHLWLADASTDAYTSNYTFNTNTLYYIRLSFDGTGYNLYISTDGKNYDTQESFGDSVFKTQPNKDLYLGSMYVTDSRYFNGTIDLSGCSLIINNQLVWRGITTTGTRIVNRNDTSRLWTAANPVLAVGEMGVETDTNKFKFGDGTTAWSSLAYAAGEGGGGDSYTKTEIDNLLSDKQDKLETGKGISIDTVLEGSMTPDWYLNGAKLDPVPDTINTPARGVTNTYLPYNNQTFSNTVDNINITWETLYAYTSSATGSSIKLIGSDGEIHLRFDGGLKGGSNTLQIDCTINSSSFLSQKFYIDYQEGTYVRHTFSFDKVTKTWKYECINTNTGGTIKLETGTTTMNIVPTDSVVNIIMDNVNGSVNGIQVKTSTFNVAGSTKEVTKINAKPDNTTIGINSRGQLACTSNILSDSNFIDFCTANADAIKAALGLS